MVETADISAAVARVAVIGGGVVGAAAALLAERSGARVWLFEPRPPELVEPPLPVAGDLDAWPIRHVALAPASLQLLRGLGVALDFPHGPFARMQVWEETGTAQLWFDAADAGCAELGRMAELPGLNAALWQRLRQVRGITAVSGEPVTDLVPGAVANTPRAPGWTLHHGSSSTEVDLVLAADGARSAVRELLNVSASNVPTGHQALATIVRTERPHSQVARQRFLLDGPLALLPTRDPHLVSIVWSQRPEEAQRRLQLTPEQFCVELSAASEAVLGTVQSVGQRAAFPISQQLAASFAPVPGVALLGDAARVLHPLAGLGVNLGLEDVAALEPLLCARPAPGDAERGALDPDAWAAWARQRRARSQLLQGALRGLQKTYGSGSPAMALLRNTGVRLLGRSALGRKVLMREALGL